MGSTRTGFNKGGGKFQVKGALQDDDSNDDDGEEVGEISDDDGEDAEGVPGDDDDE